MDEVELYLREDQKKYILESSKVQSCAWICEQLFGEQFTLEQALVVYQTMETNHCFDYLYNAEFHNEVLALEKKGLGDNDIYEKVKDKYQNIGIFQVIAVVTANSKTRRVGEWRASDRRLLTYMYGVCSKTAVQQAFYPRLLTNIQKQASRLSLGMKQPITQMRMRDSIPVGELRQILEEYDDDVPFCIVSLGDPEPVKMVKVGHKINTKGKHQNPQIVIWNI